MRVRSLFAIQSELLTPALQIVCRAINILFIKRAGVLRKLAGTGAFMLIQCFDLSGDLDGFQPNDG